MRYEVTGGNKQKREVVDTAMSYVIHLIKIPYNVYIEIVFIKSGNHGIMEYSKNRFLMEINTAVSLAEIAYTVFHEMKHVEQLTSGKLLHTHDKTFWLGEDHTETPYLQCPWEVEAYKFEKSADLVLTSIAA
jgi:hypothetical protein